MKLLESIATYTGESRRNIENILSEEVKYLIGKVVKTPDKLSSTETSLLHNGSLLDDLIEMDVLRYSAGGIKPNTAIFFAEDIERLYAPVFSLAEQIAEVVKVNARELSDASPNIRNFIGSIMGMGQGLHTVLKSNNLAANWQNKTGKFAKSKVDFNEDCPAYHKFGADLQIKRIHRGNEYTSVIIGDGNDNYCSYLWNMSKVSAKQDAQEFSNHLVTYLTDVFPLLIIGKHSQPSLEKAARLVHIDIDDKSSVITLKDARKYQPVIERISGACVAFFYENMAQVREMLLSTFVGQQGVPVENMMMNFWRYLRRSAAIKLYENGFLADQVPANGSITVFYVNAIGYFE